jgi:hypothetical protein
MNTSNAYCEALGIQAPRLEVARRSPDANTYSLLIVALLERGEPITLEAAARRFEEAGVAPADRALASLKRCRPARPPLYRDGDLYALDPHDHEADLWAFRLGLRPPKAARLQVVRPDPGPLPSPDEPLTAPVLDELWRDGIPNDWSAQRIAICVLDAHGKAMRPDDVVALVRARCQGSWLSADAASYWRRGAPIRTREDGLWELDREHDAVRSARQAVRERIATARRWAENRPEPAVIEANRKHFERKRQANAERLARMRRILLRVPRRPEAAVLLDVGREIATLIGESSPGQESSPTPTSSERSRCEGSCGPSISILASVAWRSSDLRRRPGSSTRRGRKLRITTSLLVQGSCGISRPFGDEEILRRYLREGSPRVAPTARGRRQVSPCALPVWSPPGPFDSAGGSRRKDPAPGSIATKRRSTTSRGALSSCRCARGRRWQRTGWADPWSRARRAASKEEPGWRSWLVDEEGFAIDRDEVQLARLAGEDRETR